METTRLQERGDRLVGGQSDGEGGAVRLQLSAEENRPGVGSLRNHGADRRMDDRRSEPLRPRRQIHASGRETGRTEGGRRVDAARLQT
ncbi:hypothetical protein SDC9_167404 [bioreactor metagenome]|uniref:Uncharacterized protein n=1 Tax=bioreactor metagenome TaxID=1076179 RepID=A0A645FZN4_9ZZZZ